jgi:transcriptional regulator GlxA family with amidase domain
VRIDIAVYEGLDELDVVGPLEVFRNAEAGGADLGTRLVSRGSPELLIASHGLRFLPDAPYQPGADLVVVPGGSWVARSEVGAFGEVQRGDWPKLLGAAAASGTVMAGVCTGTMLLAHAGVVGHRRAGTHHAAWDDLAATGATLVKDRVVDDGSLITSGGVTSGIDLALWVVERFFSAELADGVARQMEYPRTRPAGV